MVGRFRLIGVAVVLALALTASEAAGTASAQTVTKFSVLALPIEERVAVDGVHVISSAKLVEPGERSEVLGTDKSRCAQIDHEDALHCRIVFFFPNGKVKINGDIRFRPNRGKVPVVGGTRGYNGVSGKAVVHNRGRNSLIDFTLVT